MITTKLRILLVEDYQTDAELIKIQIDKIVKDNEVRVVDNLEDFKKEFRLFVPDVILSDYNLPTCTGLEILQLVQSYDENLPFIFITGTIDDDEMAAETILGGASGFILKKHMKNLSEKLEPLFKMVVFKMVQKEELREKVRKNKIAVNQIYEYLDKFKSESSEQESNLKNIRLNLDLIKKENNDA